MKTPTLIKVDTNTIIEVQPPADPKDGPRILLYVYERELLPSGPAARALAAVLDPQRLDGKEQS